MRYPELDPETEKDITQAMKRHGHIKCTLLSEGSQFKKATYIVWFQLYETSEKGKLKRQWKDQWLSGVPGERGEGGIVKYRGSLGQWNYYVWYGNGR